MLAYSLIVLSIKPKGNTYASESISLGESISNKLIALKYDATYHKLKVFLPNNPDVLEINKKTVIFLSRNVVCLLFFSFKLSYFH